MPIRIDRKQTWRRNWGGGGVNCLKENNISLPAEVSEILSVSALSGGHDQLLIYTSYLGNDGSARLLMVSFTPQGSQTEFKEIDLGAIRENKNAARIFSPVVFRDQNGLLKMLYIAQNKLPDEKYDIAVLGAASSNDGVNWLPVKCDEVRQLDDKLRESGMVFPWHLSVMEAGAGCSGIKSVVVGALDKNRFTSSGKNFIPRILVADLATQGAISVQGEMIKFRQPFVARPNPAKEISATLFYMNDAQLYMTNLKRDGKGKPSLAVLDTKLIPRLAPNGMAVHDRFSTILERRLVNLSSRKIYEYGVSEPSIVSTSDGLYLVYEGLDRLGYWTTGALTSRDGIEWRDVNDGKPLVDLAPWPGKGNWAAYEAAIEYVDHEYYMAVVLGTLDPLLPALEEEICFYHSRDGAQYTPRGACLVKPDGASRIGEPSLVYDRKAALWRLWFIVQRDGTRSIHYAESRDLTKWAIHKNAVLSPLGGLEAKHVACPHVEKVGGEFHMFYRMGLGNGLGYAASSDGINWKRHSQNPVIKTQYGNWFYAPRTVGPGALIGEPAVLLENGTWRIWMGIRFSNAVWNLVYFEIPADALKE